MKKNQKIVIKRIIYSIFLFFVIPIVNIVFSAFSYSNNDKFISDQFEGKKVNYLTCWENAKDKKTIDSFIITATFDGDGGTIYGDKTKTCGGSYSCKLASVPNVIKKGYTFTGWSNNNCETKIKNGSLEIEKNGDNIYKACWKKNEEKPKDKSINTTDKANEIRGTVKSGNYTYPLYDTQHTEKYKNLEYGTSTMYEAGCGVFSGAMVIAGLKNDSSITPGSYLKAIKNYFPSYSSYFQKGIGSIYPGIYSEDFIKKTYGLKIKPAGSTENALKHLEKGYPAVGRIPGHILAIIPAPESNKKKGAKFYVLDSIERSTGAYKSVKDFKTKNSKKNGSRKKGWDLSFSYLLEPSN